MTLESAVSLWSGNYSACGEFGNKIPQNTRPNRKITTPPCPGGKTQEYEHKKAPGETEKKKKTNQICAVAEKKENACGTHYVSRGHLNSTYIGIYICAYKELEAQDWKL